MIADLFLIYQFIKRLATPFNEWDAYELGIIDDKGNQLKKRRDFSKQAEHKAFGLFDVATVKLKKLLEKVPGGKTRLGSYAAALWLIKEHKTIEQYGDDYIWLEEQVIKEVTQNMVLAESYAGLDELFEKAMDEDVIVEAFDKPYPIKWEYLKPKGPSSAIAKLDDGSALDIHISEDPDGIYEIEFARGSSKKNMGRSGQGDEFRIFATVQAAMLKWWQQLDKNAAKKVTFYANKQDGNRARLYKRFLKMWGTKSKWDIEVNANAKPGLVAYTLTNPTPAQPEKKKTFLQKVFRKEDAPANNVGGGAIAGTGGAGGEPGLTKAQMKKYKKDKDQPLKRFKEFK